MSHPMRPSTNRHRPRSDRRALLLAVEFPPVGGGGVIRVTKLAKYLSRLGWTVEVACSDEPLAEAVDQSLLDELAGVRVHRIQSPVHGMARAAGAAKSRLRRTSPLFRALFALRAGVRALLAIPDRWVPWAFAVSRSSDVLRAPPSIIVASGPPHSVHIAGALLARRTGAPFVMDMRDEWTLRPLTRSRLPWRIAIERIAEAWCLRRAAALVVVSDESRARYRRRYPWAAGRITVIPNGFDPEDLSGVVPAPLGAAKELTVGYAGSFQVGTDIEPLFAAVGAITRRGLGGRPIRFEMVGPFVPRDEEIARRHVAGDALRIGQFVPHRRALELMSGWDALCVIATDGPASQAGKIYECLALGRPIVLIAPEGPATALVRELAAGTIAPPTDATRIETAIVGALEMSTSESFAGASKRELAPYDRRKQAERWSELLEALLRSG